MAPFPGFDISFVKHVPHEALMIPMSQCLLSQVVKVTNPDIKREALGKRQKATGVSMRPSDVGCVYTRSVEAQGELMTIVTVRITGGLG